VAATAFWQRNILFVMCHISFSPGNCAAVTKYLLFKNCKCGSFLENLIRFRQLLIPLASLVSPNEIHQFSTTFSNAFGGKSVSSGVIA